MEALVHHREDHGQLLLRVAWVVRAHEHGRLSYRVLLVEDDPHTRERLARSVREHAELALVGQAENCAQALALMHQHHPDAMLVDLGLPDGHGTDLIRAAEKLDVAPLCMVITAFGDEKHVIDAITAGACAYVLKDASAREITQAILDMRAGGSPISAAVARYVLAHFRNGSKPADANHDEVDRPDFSERENQVLQLVAKGYSYQEIADGLDLSINTVREHIRKIYRKLAVRSRGAAVYEAQALGLISSQP